ncbi:MAG: T9SS type A sorting domain-containing protein [Bacteroidia bacterium]|nr:T9SS type A sorting domain-containing protein [Bacteroidia bacterium]
MRKISTFLLTILSGFAFAQTTSICNPNGNIAIYSNYDGGILNINVDQNIPNLKIGIVSYEFSRINITGTYAGNVTGVWYAGFDAGNNHCSLNPPFNTVITGVANPIDTITIYPPATYNNPFGSASIICNYSCTTNVNQGGCNTPDQIVHFFQTKFNGLMRYHLTQYGCWGGPYYLSQGGNCCATPPTGLLEFAAGEWSMGPNPSNGSLTMNFSDLGNHEIELIDVLGRSVWKEMKQGSSVSLDLSTLPKGQYYVMVRGENGLTSGKRWILQ